MQTFMREFFTIKRYGHENKDIQTFKEVFKIYEQQKRMGKNPFGRVPDWRGGARGQDVQEGIPLQMPVVRL